MSRPQRPHQIARTLAVVGLCSQRRGVPDANPVHTSLVFARLGLMSFGPTVQILRRSKARELSEIFIPQNARIKVQFQTASVPAIAITVTVTFEMELRTVLINSAIFVHIIGISGRISCLSVSLQSCFSWPLWQQPRPRPSYAPYIMFQPKLLGARKLMDRAGPLPGSIATAMHQTVTAFGIANRNAGLDWLSEFPTATIILASLCQAGIQFFVGQVFQVFGFGMMRLVSHREQGGALMPFLPCVPRLIDECNCQERLPPPKPSAQTG